MDQFVNHIIEDIDPTKLDSLQNYSYIFPTRRGGIHFQNALLAHFKDKTFIAPRIYSIQNFVEYVTGRKTTDEMTLLFELYDVYLDYDKQLETFDQFYPWGEILLKDFDEIDKYLVNAEDLYQNIYDLKKIEAIYGLDEDAVEAVKGFREVLSAENQSELLQKFLTVWEIVGKVYYSFKMALTEKKMAYEGMLYREMVQIIGQGKDKFKGSHLVFCGFNALSNAEEEIFNSLLEQERATFYWDADKMMLENNWHESGLFLRKYKEKWVNPESKWIITDLMHSNKKIEIIKTAQKMAQVKTAASILENLAEDHNLEQGETVIVLADENLLFPMLYGMPPAIKTINVSVGYPALASHLALLINHIFQLHITKRGGKQFRVEFIEKIAASGYLQLIAPDEINDLRMRLLDNRRTYMSFDSIEGILGKNEMIMSIFTPTTNSKKFLKLLSQFMRGLFDFFIKKKERGPSFEEEIEEIISGKENPRFSEDDINKLPYLEEMDFLFYAIKHLLEFQDHLEEHLPRIKLPLLRKMFSESLSTLKIPFEGKTDIGLQMMGFLETRTLDFENLLILSVNEGQLPTERKLNSFVPFSLRKAFKMPTFEEQDAIYAYHFYRLLQRTQNVFLLYDGEAGVEGSKERSRYIPQLIRLAEQAKGADKIQVTVKQVATKSNSNKKETATIEIEKTEAVLAILNNKFVDNRDKSEEEKEALKSFAPTTLTTYIRCPLQFYFKYIAELKQERDYTKEIEAGDIGTIVHKVLEVLYIPFLNEEITLEIIDKLKQPIKIKQEIEKVLSALMFIDESYTELVGKNVITFNICRQIVENVLEKDKDFIPFKIKSVETKPRRVWIQADVDQYVWLQGTIDRVDELLEDEVKAARIVDYKTGKIIKPKINIKKQTIESYLETFFENPDYSAAFQAYFYAYLFYKNDPVQPVQAGIYALQEINKGVQILYPENEALSEELFLAFEYQLKTLLQELLDPKTPFKQTEDVKRCRFCDYKEICER